MARPTPWVWVPVLDPRGDLLDLELHDADGAVMLTGALELDAESRDLLANAPAVRDVARFLLPIVGDTRPAEFELCRRAMSAAGDEESQVPEDALDLAREMAVVRRERRRDPDRDAERARIRAEHAVIKAAGGRR